MFSNPARSSSAATSSADPLKIVGVDVWPWRRNHRYGTIVCDLERQRIKADPVMIAAIEVA